MPDYYRRIDQRRSCHCFHTRNYVKQTWNKCLKAWHTENYTKYNTEGLYQDRKRSGRPPNLSKCSMRVIHRTCLQNRAMSITKNSNAFNVGRSVHIGRDTAGRILKKYSLRSHWPFFKPFIIAKQRKRRMELARSKVNWDSDRWTNRCQSY